MNFKRIARLPGLLALLCLCTPLALARHSAGSHPEGGPAGQFDYYLLTLSWAPSYCLLNPGDRSECGGKGYGFVLHGLWPQFDAGGYPENCASDQGLDGPAAVIGRTIYPSARLMQHEWATHGTCSGLSAADYFRLADQALAVLKVPQAFEAPPANQELSSQQIAEAFLAANPGLDAAALTVGCRRDTLSQVQLCLTRDLKPRSCGRRVRSNCGEGTIQVPSSR